MESCVEMQPVLSLYEMCLKRVHRLMKAGTWKSFSINPFSNLPCKIVDDVMTRTLNRSRKISEISPLLTSGSLTCLVLDGCLLQEERGLFQNIIQRNCFQSLRYLDWHNYRDGRLKENEKKSIPLIEALVRVCPKLEEFSSNYVLNLDAFQNCKGLKVLKFYASFLMLSRVELSVLSSLKNLKVFFSFDKDGDIIASVLEYCPQLISLGRIDSLDGLDMLHTNVRRTYGHISNSGLPEHFQLKRVLWGKRGSFLGNKVRVEFPEKVRLAVSLCPFVEKLTINLQNAAAILKLQNLKHLTCLDINFNTCYDYYITLFVALISEIGEQLKCLTILSDLSFPADIICELCPQLKSLIFKCPITANWLSKPICNVTLKNLEIRKTDWVALVFLLSSYKVLEYLKIFNGKCLEDGLLFKILSQNPLEKLKACHIFNSNVTTKGFRMLLEKAESLKSVNFRPSDEIVQNLIQELNLQNITYSDNFKPPIRKCHSMQLWRKERDEALKDLIVS